MGRLVGSSRWHSICIMLQVLCLSLSLRLALISDGGVLVRGRRGPRKRRRLGVEVCGILVKVIELVVGKPVKGILNKICVSHQVTAASRVGCRAQDRTG